MRFASEGEGRCGAGPEGRMLQRLVGELGEVAGQAVADGLALLHRLLERGELLLVAGLLRVHAGVEGVQLVLDRAELLGRRADARVEDAADALQRRDGGAERLREAVGPREPAEQLADAERV